MECRLFTQVKWMTHALRQLTDKKLTLSIFNEKWVSGKKSFNTSLIKIMPALTMLLLSLKKILTVGWFMDHRRKKRLSVLMRPLWLPVLLVTPGVRVSRLEDPPVAIPHAVSLTFTRGRLPIIYFPALKTKKWAPIISGWIHTLYDKSELALTYICRAPTRIEVKDTELMSSPIRFIRYVQFSVWVKRGAKRLLTPRAKGLSLSVRWSRQRRNNRDTSLPHQTSLKRATTIRQHRNSPNWSR